MAIKYKMVWALSDESFQISIKLICNKIETY